MYTTSVIVLRYSSKSCLVKMVATLCGQTFWIANENTVVNPHLYIEGEEGEGNAYREPEPTTSLPCPPRSLSNVIPNFSVALPQTICIGSLTTRICYTRFRVSNPICTLHATIARVIIAVLERQGLVCIPMAYGMSMARVRLSRSQILEPHVWL